MTSLTHPENRDPVCGATKGDLVCLEPAGHDYPHHAATGDRWVDGGQAWPEEASDAAENLPDFVKAKIAEVEKSIAAREQSRKCFLSGDDKGWEASAKFCSKITGRRHEAMSKAKRLESAASEARILVKLRHELEMFKALLNMVETALK